MLTPNQFNELREKVQAEIERRNSCGSLEEYKKEIKTNVSSGDVVVAADADDVIHPLLAIQDYDGLILPKPGGAIPETFDNSLITYVNELSNISMTSTSTSCRGACTGLCVGSCGNTCDGCTSSCGGCTGCSASCGTGCASGMTK